MRTLIECPHCHVVIRTKRIFSALTRLRCPRCGAIFHLIPDDGGLTEVIPIDEERIIPVDSRPLSPISGVPRTTNKPTHNKSRGKTGIEHSRTMFAGILGICALGLAVLFINWYVGTVRELDITAKKASDARTEQIGKLSKVSKPTRVSPTTTDPRIAAPGAARVGNLSIGVTGVEAKPLQPDGPDYLHISLRITNHSSYEYHHQGWHHKPLQIPILRDQSRNHYNFIKFNPNNLPTGCATKAIIQPQETISDLIIFENPFVERNSQPPIQMGLTPARPALELDIQIGVAVYKFAIPSGLLTPARPRTVPLPPPMVAQAPPPPPPEPVKTAEDLILEEFRERWVIAHRLARTKGNGAKNYLRLKRLEIVNELAVKYNIPRSQVKELVTTIND